MMLQVSDFTTRRMAGTGPVASPARGSVCFPRLGDGDCCGDCRRVQAPGHAQRMRLVCYHFVPQRRWRYLGGWVAAAVAVVSSRRDDLRHFRQPVRHVETVPLSLRLAPAAS